MRQISPKTVSTLFNSRIEAILLKMNLTARSIIIVYFALLSYGCETSHTFTNKATKMTEQSPDDFSNIEHGDGNPNKCTPKIDDNFSGIKIHMPKEIIWTAKDRNPISGAFAKVMLCGVYRLPASQLVDTSGFIVSASVMATNIKTHENYIALLQENNFTEDPEPSEISTEELKGVYETGYFAINILEVLDLPEKAGEYMVFVSFKTYQSNKQTITIKPGK